MIRSKMSSLSNRCGSLSNGIVVVADSRTLFGLSFSTNDSMEPGAGEDPIRHCFPTP